MSLILKGIDLPKDEEPSLKLLITSEGDVYKRTKDDLLYIGASAQATQIPKGHGRVIDGGWVKYNLENYSDLPTKYLHMDLVREAIEDAPTILEAEE